MQGKRAMKPCTRMGIAIFAVLFALIPLQAANAAGPGGGGHGGGGHGGGHGGFSGHSSGSSSGHGVGHAIGHSLGHLIGHHDKSPAAPSQTMISPFAVERTVHDNAALRSRSQFVFASEMRHRIPGRRFNDFPFGHRFFGPGFGFGNCDAFGFPRPFGFSSVNCFGGGFFFDPFFFDPFFVGGGPAFFGSGPAILPFADQGPDYVPADSTAPPPPDMGAGAEKPCDSDAAGESGGAGRNSANCQRPVTLLQLRDGSMYGLTDYWIENAELHYITTYGGQNSIGLDRIDFDKTVKLNADRGVPFVLRPKPPTP
jgi:hypothetical protein